MLVTRWQAPIIPTKEQIKLMFHAEGLTINEELYEAKTKITTHRHPFDEIRMVISGELKINVAGNQLLLRAGDRIEIPSNTRHETEVFGDEPCFCITAQRPPL